MRARFLLASLTIFGLLGLGASARAEVVAVLAPSFVGSPSTVPTTTTDPSSSSTAEADDGRRSYRTTIIWADVLSVAVLASGFKTGKLAAISVPIYLLAPPAIHFSHDKPGTAAGSFLLRAGLPAALGLGLYTVTDLDNCDEFCLLPVAATVGGIAVGSLTAMFIDWFVLSWEDVPPAAAPAPSLSITPQIGMDGQSVTLGIGGRF
ncbi:hypothetical protein [Haliangium sp.]|uniref:hypothetical protein n=1 Tax=Haliangium sp. TaxID=2663208 RepID=UPI003D114DF9